MQTEVYIESIRVLYASRIVAVDDNTQKKVVCLEKQVRSLKSRIESTEKSKRTCLGIASPGQVQAWPSELIAMPEVSQGQILSASSEDKEHEDAVDPRDWGTQLLCDLVNL
ncbi:hypothetical protein NE237_010471 [Protea cynaroides]|uniref:Uncharacterized protein n=1 Tax=Protea cynaroides TaxID=273540 RepID=A0A9Q0KZU7_9MAGN|nr:hypothetical protein NE237_010471 [Protea cynaroides]